MRRYLKKVALGFACSWLLFGQAFAVVVPTMTGNRPISQHVINQQNEIDRTQLVTQQIELLKTRLLQAQNELQTLQQQHDQFSQLALEKASKTLLDKSNLDISIAQSNLDSINIELADSQQNIIWLEKNIQEVENQLNVLGIFGLKMLPTEPAKIREYHVSLQSQLELLDLEKIRFKYLQNLQEVANRLLQLRTDKYNELNMLLKSRRTFLFKEQQVKDELAYQQLQSYWLAQLNQLYTRLGTIDPGASADSKDSYSEIERAIFYANENANFAYIRSLVARYKDQIQQMNTTIQRTSSISLLNEIRDQAQVSAKQVSKLDSVMQTRLTVLEKHIAYFNEKKNLSPNVNGYVQNLTALRGQYHEVQAQLKKLNEDLLGLRTNLDQALQTELSSRQGFPSFSMKTWVDLGKEMLLVPALTFQVVKNISNQLHYAFRYKSVLSWASFLFAQLLLCSLFVYLRNLLANLSSRTHEWENRLNPRWLGLEWLRRNFLGMFVVGNAIATMFFFGVPLQDFISLLYVALVYLVFKGLMTLSRLSLVETTHDTAGHDVRLYHRLKGIILVGGIVTALTVFVHQLPLIYELKTLCDRLFLFQLMIVSLLLLRSWDVVPKLILSHMDTQHPYFQKSITVVGLLIPLLMFGNAVIGLFGYVNLIMTVAGYEGIFLVVLIGYLILRGLLSDAMEQLSRLMIQYVNNGWLWTEAFLKPIDKVLRITLLCVAGAVLFLLYGWDKQSPIVERLTRLLHYNVVTIFHSVITPISIIQLFIAISIFYWTAKWTREFVYRLLLSRTQDMGIRNSIAILTQYTVIMVGGFLCLRMLGIDLSALAVFFSVFAFSIGWGLRDLANNFVCGFLILLERPLRVGDIVTINDFDGEVVNIGSRAVTVRTWEHTELVVPNAEIFNKSFTNWTSKDNIVRSMLHVKISRYDNPHEVKILIQNVLSGHKEVLQDPAPQVFLKEMTDACMEFELRYFVNIRQVKARLSVASSILMTIWDKFSQHGIKPPHPQQEILLRNERPTMNMNREIQDPKRLS